MGQAETWVCTLGVEALSDDILKNHIVIKGSPIGAARQIMEMLEARQLAGHAAGLQIRRLVFRKADNEIPDAGLMEDVVRINFFMKDQFSNTVDINFDKVPTAVITEQPFSLSPHT